MAKKNQLIDGLTLDSEGRVKLSDDMLDAFEDLPAFSTAGANNSGQCQNTENSACANTGNCSQSINSSSCNNSQNCEATSNAACPGGIYDPGPGGA